MAFVTYPAILTNKDWQKNKGAIAKFAGKTGLGPELDKLEVAFKKVDQGKLTAGGYGKLHNKEEIDNAQKQAKDYYAKNVQPVRDLALAVSRKGGEVEKDFKSKKTIPKKSTEHVGKLAKEALNFATALKSFDAEWKTFDEQRAKLQAHIDLSKKKMDVDIKNAEGAIKECLKAGATAQAWEDHVHQRCRSICNGIKIVPEWNKDQWGTWQKFGDHYHEKGVKKGGPDEAKQIAAKCKELVGELQKLKTYLKKA
jgi:hypothetical protein